MQEIFNEWRKFTLLNEISLDQAKKRFKTKALTSFIKKHSWDEEAKTLRYPLEVIYELADTLGSLLLSMVPGDLTDNQQGTMLEWLISKGIHDPRYSATFFNEVTVTAGVEMDVTHHNLQPGRWASLFERFFHYQEFMKKKDVFGIDTFQALENVVREAGPDIDAHQEKKAYLDAEEGTEVFRDDDKWKIYAIHNKGAACELGKGTEWCTAAPGLDYFEEYYSAIDPLFYLRDVRRGARFQLHFGSDQFMDEEDYPVLPDLALELANMLVRAGASEKYPIIDRWVDLQRVKISDDPAELVELAKQAVYEDQIEMRQEIARNDATPPALLSDLAKYDEPETKAIIATNPATPLETQLELAVYDEGDPEGNVLDALVSATEFPQVLTKLASLEFPVVEPPRGVPGSSTSEPDYHSQALRAGIAQNPFTPPKILRQYAKLSNEEDDKGWTRMGLVRNRKVPLDVLETLAKLGGDDRPKGKHRVGDSPEKIADFAKKTLAILMDYEGAGDRDVEIAPIAQAHRREHGQ